MRERICLTMLCGMLTLVTSVAPAVVYVDCTAPGVPDGETWETAFHTIQEGVDAAYPDGEVWVADGVYTENIMIVKPVQVYGGFRGDEESREFRDFVTNVTTIDGGQQGSCVTMYECAVVDGFRITNGSGMAFGDVTCGGGFYCDSLDRGTGTGFIRNNVIIGNSATQFGGAIYCVKCTPLVIENNRIGGDQPGDVNTAGDFGGGIYCGLCSPTIAGNVLTHNVVQGFEGGAICCRDYSSPMIIGNTFTHNHGSDYGGGIACMFHCCPTIVNNMISNGNWGYYGGAISCTLYSAPDITNNTLTGNIAQEEGSAIYCDSSSPNISSNIVTENKCVHGYSVIYVENAGLLYLWNNDIWGNIPYDRVWNCSLVDCISEDPEFCDAANQDYHLKPSSPCIDAGLNSAPGVPPVDFDGDPRIIDSWPPSPPPATVDIGADEAKYARCDEPMLPGWNWFSIPWVPDGELYPTPNADAILGFSCVNRLFSWDENLKCFLLYTDDFDTIEAGRMYMLRLELGEEYTPCYQGLPPDMPYGRVLPSAGWAWVGVPDVLDIAGLDLCVSKDGQARMAGQDIIAPDPWLNWNWVYWDSQQKTCAIMNPFGGADDDTLHPWYGYMVWANTDNVTIIFPQPSR
jgi:predicted outer membrane repeat protein